MPTHKKIDKSLAYSLLGIGTFCFLLQIFFIFTLNTYFLYLIGFFLLVFPLGLIGYLSDNFSEILNKIASNESQKQDYKMISLIAIYYSIIGFIFLVFSTLVFNIKLNTGSSDIDGIALSWIIIIGSILTSGFYGLKFLLPKK